MFTIDKIKKNVDKQIINTIDSLVKMQDINSLKQWLKACNQEINKREIMKENTYLLYLEKEYLEMVIINN